ncbi:MAG: 50S ribosomal protein L23 [Patescibacteria group bacterium]
MSSFWDRLKFKKKPFKEASREVSVHAPKEAQGEKKEEGNALLVAMAGLASIEASRTLLHPYLSEKAALLGEHSVAVFEVDTRVSAADVSRAVHALYGIRPVAVRMVTLRGRAVRFGKTLGKTKTRKKAMVTLPEGKKIDLLK